LKWFIFLWLLKAFTSSGRTAQDARNTTKDTDHGGAIVGKMDNVLWMPVGTPSAH